jgi:hypothetical protein
MFALSMKRHLLFILSFLFPFFSVMAQIESGNDSLVVRSDMIRSYTFTSTGADSRSFFYWHTYKKASESDSRWVGIYGGNLRRDFDFDPESKKYMNRFRNWTIAKQVSLGVALPLFGVFAYNAWTYDDVSSPSQIALVVAGAVPTTMYIIIPYFKKNALKKAAINYNRNRLR